MNQADPATGQGLEFEAIARLFRPLTFGAPEALGLMDDAAVLPGRAGFDLVVTQDAMVESVHFLATDPPDLVGRKLLRVNLSDLAVKGAEPYAAFLTVAWPARWRGPMREAFARGLGADLERFGCKLLGGDTVQTPGPFVASLTLLGWVPAGAMVKRSGAKAGDVLLVSGAIGDGSLGLEAARGGLLELGAELQAELAERYRLPEPRLSLGSALRAHAAAAADVSDGLLADAGHIGEASGCGVEIRLEALPLSEGARAWLGRRSEVLEARLQLATGGDDYEVVCAARPGDAPALIEAAQAQGVGLAVIGAVVEAPGVHATFLGRPVPVSHTGWSHS